MLVDEWADQGKRIFASGVCRTGRRGQDLGVCIKGEVFHNKVLWGGQDPLKEWSVGLKEPLGPSWVLSWGGGVFHGFIMVHHNPNHLHQPTIKFAGFLPIIFLPLPAPPKRKMFFSFPISTELRAHSSKPLKAVLINNQNHFAIVP